MCRDGYRAKCAKQHCAETVTCRDWPHMCPEHAAYFDFVDDDDTITTAAGITNDAPEPSEP